MTSKAPTTTIASDTLRDTRSGDVRSHGLQALAHHIATHDLPAPWSVDMTGHIFDGLYLNIPVEDAVAWTSTVVVDLSNIEDHPGGYCHYSATGRLPDTGVRVRLTWITLGNAQAVSA